MLGEVAVPDQRTDTNAAVVRQLLDLREREPIDVDELLRPLDADLHEVDQICSATEELGLRVRGEGADRALRMCSP